MIINGRRLKGMQTYKEKGSKDYMMVDMLTTNSSGNFESLSTAIAEQPSSLCISSIHSEYLGEKCRPVAWKQVPKEWKDAFIERLEFPEVQFKRTEVKTATPQMKLF